MNQEENLSRFKKVANATKNPDFLRLLEVYQELVDRLLESPNNELVWHELAALDRTIELTVETDTFRMTEDAIDDK